MNPTTKGTHGGGWTEERTAEAVLLWSRGLSAGEIAKRLGAGLTRNAVIAKLHRFGATNRGHAAHPNAARWPAETLALARVSYEAGGGAAGAAEASGMPAASVYEAAKRYGWRSPNGKPKADSPTVPTATRKAVVRAALAAGTPVPPYAPPTPRDESAIPITARPFAERRTGQCWWPYGEGVATLSCCAPVVRGGLCEGHAAGVGYQPQSSHRDRTRAARQFEYLARQPGRAA